MSGVNQNDAQALVGKIIDERYRVLQHLAEGLLGSVFKVEENVTGEICALKIFRRPENDHLSVKEFAQRCLGVGEKLKTFQHNNAAGIEASGIYDGCAYWVMPFSEGESLASILANRAPLPLERVYIILSQVAAALDAAHKHRLIHRDLNTANILLTEVEPDKDFVQVLNTGITEVLTSEHETTVSRSGAILGDPKYMSPEQVRGEAADERSDIYSLGVILYEMLTGVPPFEDDSVMDLLMKHVTDEPMSIAELRPDLPNVEAISEVVGRALGKAREQRPVTAGHLLREFSEAAQISLALPLFETRASSSSLELLREVDESGPLPHRVPSSRRRSNRTPILIGAGLALCLLGVIFYALISFPWLLDLPLAGERNKPTAVDEETTSELLSKTLPANGTPQPDVSGQLSTDTAVGGRPSILDSLELQEVPEESSPPAEPSATANTAAVFSTPTQAAGHAPAHSPVPEISKQPAAGPSAVRAPSSAASPAASPAASTTPAAKTTSPAPANSSLARKEPAAAPSASPAQAGQAPAKSLAKGWWIQITAKESPEDAAAVEGKVKAAGFETSREQAVVNGTRYYRVLIGPLPDLATAKAKKQDIVSRGLAKDGSFIKEVR